MNLSDLNDRWNELRNAVIGRDGKPTITDAALAAEVARAHASWRAFWEQTDPADFALPVTIAYGEWIELHQALAQKVQAAGVRLDAKTVIAPTGPQALASTIQSIPLYLAGGVAVVGLSYLLIRLIGGSSRD